MIKKYLISNINLISIIVFLFFFLITIYIKPSLIFDKNGNPREFGIGYKNKTVVPIWLVVIILAIFSYLSVLYYINFNKFVF